MLISDAYAQGAGGGGSGLEAFLPLILIFVVFYFLLIRPQQKKMKNHKAMLAAIKRGDQIVTGGGVYGKVHKVQDDGVLVVDIAEGVRVKVAQETVSAVIDKTQPVGNAANQNQKSGGFLSGLFGGGARQTTEQPANTDQQPVTANDSEAESKPASNDAEGPAADEPKKKS